MAFDADVTTWLPQDRGGAAGRIGSVLLFIGLSLTMRWMVETPPRRLRDLPSAARADIEMFAGLTTTTDRRVLVRDVPATGYRAYIDLNRCDWPELCLLPGINEILAQRMIRVRQERGPFRSLEDLERVPGIGNKTARRLAPWIDFSLGRGRLRPEDSTSLRSLAWDTK